MKLKVALVVMGLLAGMVTIAAPPAQALEAGCRPTDAGFRCLYPMTVKYDGMTEVFRMVESPGTAGFLTSARATLVDDEGRRVGHHMAHLHHAVWVNPQKQDLACPQWPDRFFGSGKERTPMRLPDGYGYEVGPNDWGFTAHIDGMHAGHPGTFEAFIKLDLGFAPADAGLTDISPVWFSVTGECDADAEFDVPRVGRRYSESDSWVATQSGRFIAAAGHLHDGGIELRLKNATTSGNIFTSRALYERRPREFWYLTRMTSFVQTPGIAVDEGDRLRLTAVYDGKRRWPSVMGIMLGAFVPEEDVTGLAYAFSAPDLG
jgi:hypothetical protein